MAITDPFVLPADVLMVTAGELSAELRRQTRCADDDIILTRRNARATSLVVNADTAALLDVFRNPLPIVDAVVTYSRQHNIDPEATLTGAYPILHRLMEARLLVPADAVDQTRIARTVDVGDRLLTCEVVRCVQVLEDTEVYLVRTPDNDHAAAKLLRPTASHTAREVLRNEGAVLAWLDGRVGPRLIEIGDHKGWPVVLSQWCRGIAADRCADELRLATDVEQRRELQRLCVDITQAFADLHSLGVIHGDVHPRNILVDSDGSVTLIDFGLARRLGPADGPSVHVEGRGGIGFLFEPELAEARLQGRYPPPPSELGEQYALGALLYLLVTGLQYTDFAIDERVAMQQILHDPVLPFAARGRVPWPELEIVLATAMEKEPAKRHRSMLAMAANLRALPVPSVSPKTHREPSRIPRQLVGAVLDRLRLGGPLLRSGGPAAPRSSVTYGAGGIAYALYRMACLRGDAQLLSLADVWAEAATQPHADDEQWINKAVGVTAEQVGEVSPYHRLAGVQVVRAMIGHAMGNLPFQRSAASGFVAESGRRCDSIDLTLGRSGTLLACGLLYECLGADPMSVAPVSTLGDAEFDQHLRRIGDYGPIRDNVDLDYLGIAHGWAGVLYTLLYWCRATGRVPPGEIERRLNELAELGEPTGRGLQWQVRTALPNAATGYMAGWCNGSAGYIHLWSLAHERTGDDRYLALAERAAWHAWEEPEGIASLCCGLAGRAYGLLRLYRHVQEGAWLRRARDLAARAAAAIASTDAFPDSLYKGKVGVALLAEEFSDPSSAAMPLFETEGWPVSSGRG